MGMDVSDAMAGPQWQKLKELVATIDSELNPGQQQQKACQRAQAAKEGKCTRAVIEQALKGLGGEATYREIVEWISENPDQVAECKESKLNDRASASKKRKGPVWHATLQSALFKYRKKGDKTNKEGPARYCLVPEAEAALVPVADQAAESSPAPLPVPARRRLKGMRDVAAGEQRRRLVFGTHTFSGASRYDTKSHRCIARMRHGTFAH